MDFLSDLNDEQIVAVKSTDGPVLVLAGAGSGKTRVLTYKIAYIISERMARPEEILAVTFTNKAAGEMKERIESLLSTLYFPYLGTFHSFCARILRAAGESVGINKNFVIYDDHDCKMVLREILKELEIDDDLITAARSRSAIGRLKNKCIGPESCSLGSFDFDSRIISEIYALYQRKLRSCNALDFDDLLMETRLLLKNDENVLRAYGERFKYILIDEYQDINLAQYEIMSLLASFHRNITVVGDDDQSIYGFRGAELGILLKFEGDFPETRLVKLERNYRSTGSILDAANELMRHNRLRKEKNLWTDREQGDKIGYFEAPDGNSEALFVARKMRELMRTGGYSFRDFAIFYRINAQSRILEEALISEGIPYRIVGGIRFYERKEIKDLLSYLRIIVNPVDAVSFKRIINTPPRGVGKVTLKKIEEIGKAGAVDLIDATGIFLREESCAAKTKDKLAHFVHVIERARESLSCEAGHRILELVLSETGYREHILTGGTAEGAAREENVNELLSKVMEYEKSAEDITLQAFLAHISLISDIDLWEPSEGKVNLMTFHSAKGLEFSVVILTGLEERFIPHAMCCADESQVEEERRLLYVGITRAKERLFLTMAVNRYERGENVERTCSRFLEELPEHLIEMIGHERGKARFETDDSLQGERFSAGDLVLHEIFGAGRVLEVSGDAIFVQFEDRSRQIVRSYLSKEKASEPPFDRGDRVIHRQWGSGIVCSIYERGREMLVSFPKVGAKRVKSIDLCEIPNNLDENIRI